MNIQWLGHSCFRITSGDYAIVLDPYGDGVVPGLRPLRTTADEVLCSHGHRDHNAVETVALTGTGTPSPFTVMTLESAHDDEGGAVRGMNTMVVLEADGIRVAHLGDLGTVLTAAQQAQIGPLDALMIPVGGYYTIDARSAEIVADMLRPTVTIPMHYRTAAYGYPEIGTLEAYLALASNVVRYDADAIDITRGMPVQTAVLSLPQ